MDRCPLSVVSVEWLYGVVVCYSVVVKPIGDLTHRGSLIHIAVLEDCIF